MGRTTDEQMWPTDPPSQRHRQIISPHVHPVRPIRSGDIGPVVDNDQASRDA